MKDEHNKAAEHHESAAKSHRAAADSHGSKSPQVMGGLLAPSGSSGCV